jgi:hypothetical protein
VVGGGRAGGVAGLDKRHEGVGDVEPVEAGGSAMYAPVVEGVAALMGVLGAKGVCEVVGVGEGGHGGGH